MPLRKTNFTITQDDLTKAIDVDDSAGRSVPVNMNFVEEGFLTKDTGSVAVGKPTAEKAHSLFLYEKKNGERHYIRAKGGKLQEYSAIDREWYDIPGSPTFTAGAEFGFQVYNDELLGGNGVDPLFKWDATTFTSYPSAPKGNILEIFEDRLFVSGVADEPLTTYYSNVGVPTTFSVADLVKPLGTDRITFLRNYYGALLIFKERTIWKLTFQYDQVLADFVPKLELQVGDYGACSRKAVANVENDLWFFTGREVRSIGYQDNVTGVFGVNRGVISDAIKETLKRIDPDNFAAVVTFYSDRRYYLAAPLAGETADTTFVCHTLYNSSWTKYAGRDKARANDFLVIDSVIHSTVVGGQFGVIKWTVVPEDAQPTSYYLTTED